MSRDPMRFRSTPPAQPAAGGALGRLGRVCYRRRWWVLVAWIVCGAALVIAGFRYAAPADDDFTGGQSDSAIAQQLVARHFPGQRGDALTLAIHADAGVSDPRVRARVQPLLTTLGSAPHVTSVSSPYAVPGQVSRDGRTAFASVQTDVSTLPQGEVSRMIAEVRDASGGGVTCAIGGPSVAQVETPYGGPTESAGGIAAMIVLLIAFGSVLAMGLPMLTGVFGIGTGLAAIGLLGHLFPAPSFTPVVASLIGLGVGVDYALFIVTRFREQLAEGAEPEEAAASSMATAGRSVLFAGITVVIGLLGLFVMQQQLLNAVAVAASVTVLMTMVAALTLLPALLGFAGRNIDRLRLPFLGRQRSTATLSERWAALIQRRPLVWGVLAAAVLLLLATPALSMRLSFEDSSTQPHDTSGYASHAILARGFGAGYDAPIVIVAQVPPGGADLTRVVDAVRATPGVASVSPARLSPDGRAAELVAFPSTGLQDPATPALVHTLRQRVVPQAAAGSGARLYVGGPTAATVDFADSVSARLPYLIAVVVGLSLLVLLVLVRSVTIAVKAAVMSLISIAAAYGVLTAVVQWGWLGGPLGFPTAMPITTWVPLFMFPILFGLSTDYEVFLISRIREVHDAGAPTRDAVRLGLGRTARVITAAAAIMVTVFVTTLLGADIAVKQFGLGLAVAVFVDATVVRMVLVPAAMELLGSANWWLPRPLARLLPGTAPERAVR